MTEIRVTKKSAIEEILRTCEIRPEVREVLEKMVVSLEKSASRPRKPSKKQEENEIIKAIIADNLPKSADEACKVIDLIKSVPELDGFTTQKVSALIKQIDGVNRVVVKGRTHFYMN